MTKKKIDKATLRQRIQELEIDNELKSQLLDAVNEKKTFGLVWENHPEDAEERLKSMLPVLCEDKSAAIISDADDAPNHVLIEGDNLEALTALCYTHEGKVDVIYIDPPYNTGNKDFVYNDSFVDSEDGYRHSKWLSFMEKRLKIAHKLLADGGSLFISIDENELYDLKILCDEIFSEANFLGQWNWFKSATPPALSLKIKRNLEYLIGYEKGRCSIKYKGIQKTSGSNDPLTKPQNTYKELTFPACILNVKLSDQVVKAGVYGTAKFPNELLNDMIVEDGKNVNEVTFRNRFIWVQNTLDEQIANNTIFDLSKQLVLSYKRASYNPEVPPNIIDESVNVDTTEEAGKQLAEIIGSGKFNHPKPVSLIRYILNFRPAATILDFFAGSGTTLHATMQLNAEDGGHRQCILVTNNENNICRDVTYERNKRVIQGYTTPKGIAVEGLKNNNLRYYRTDFVSRQSSHQNKKEQAYAMLDLLCIKENVYDEQKMFGSLSSEGKDKLVRYFADDNTKMLLIYDTRVVPYIVREIAAMTEEELNIKTYIFADGSFPYTADFEEVLSKVTLVAMPFSMNKALSNVLPAENEIELNDEPDTEEE